MEPIRIGSSMILFHSSEILVENLHLPEAESEVFLISAAVSEPRTWWLGFANTTTLVTAVNLGFVEAEHLYGL